MSANPGITPAPSGLGTTPSSPQTPTPVAVHIPAPEEHATPVTLPQEPLETVPASATEHQEIPEEPLSEPAVPTAPEPEPTPQLQGNSVAPEVDLLMARIQQAQLPGDLKEKAVQQINRINLTLKYGGSLSQLDITAKYVDWITTLPWTQKTEDNLNINAVKASLDSSHFGLEPLKKKILEYLAIIALQKKQGITDYHVQSPFFVGLAGTGKTTFAKAIAEALGRKFVRIPFGGLSSARDLRGQSKTSPESEPGYVMKALRDAQVRNPVIPLDELDRVSPEARAEIMGVLLELLDPGQNMHFTDYFIDYAFNLNEVLFVATGNNTTNVAAAVLDRLDVIQMPNYNDEEKIAIGKNYVLPSLRKNAGLTEEQLQIEDDVWPLMVRPLGFEPGVRSLERMVSNVVRKVALNIVSGEGTTYKITKDNVKQFTNIIVGGQQ